MSTRADSSSTARGDPTPEIEGDLPPTRSIFDAYDDVDSDPTSSSRQPAVPKFPSFPLPEGPRTMLQSTPSRLQASQSNRTPARSWLDQSTLLSPTLNAPNSPPEASSTVDSRPRLPMLPDRHMSNGNAHVNRAIVVQSDPSMVTCFDPNDPVLYDLWVEG